MENNELEQNPQQENNQSNSIVDTIGHANPVDVIEVLVEAGKSVVNTSKDIISSIVDNIDIN
ncbi:MULTISPECIES: hypothetical protein [Acinetobacter]|uniref:hypothetical protein n=1 Tax=Acinetobacter TaxID=469 RepID=UPI0015D1C726|nr:MULTISPECIES: hypothetical protein [Acinetobacter]MCL6232822.1 hypothetical protein [Acinetobacter amyesii]MCL6237031.1 hypothetical protein [Acinetobacter amyesii]